MAQIRPPVAPSLPQPPVAYDSNFHERHSNTLRLYFNQISNAMGQLLQGFNNYAAFVNTGTITAAAANTAYPVAYTATIESFGITLSGTPTTRITVPTAGVYSFQFSAQLDSSGGTHYAHIWFRINGVDVPDSANKIAVVGATGEAVAARGRIVTMQAGDYLELMWAVDDTAVTLAAAAAAAPVPATPSVVMNVYYLFPNSA
jgi:hypothetical protein